MSKITEQILQEVSLALADTPAQQSEKAQILADCKALGEALLHRSCDRHFTASALVCSPDLEQVLLVHHNLYHTYAWPGGHVDGGADFLAEALREVREETGLETVIPMTSKILSLDRLPVPEQEKKGKTVPAHVHYSVGYGFVSSPELPVRCKDDENSDVRWVPVSEMERLSGEPHMIVIYRRILSAMKGLRQKQQALYALLPEHLVPWYKENARSLPWRKDREPYHVWLSEIMLQQTRVEAVKGYYQRFLQTFPTIEALANGDEETLLKLWEGLGYYNRARNLQKAARKILTDYGGQFPTTQEEILALPGIGAYTAGAIGSICFEQPTPAIDGNVLRVVSRITESFVSIDDPNGKRQMTKALSSVYPAGHSGDFTQSLMELGATVCVPKGQPQCEQCPLADICLAHENGTEQLLPVKKKKAPRREENRTVFVLRCGDALAVRRRTERGVLHGLWELPNVAGTLAEGELGDVLARWGITEGELERQVQRDHIFTHITWHMTCYYFQCQEKAEQFTWVTEQERQERFALPTAFRMFLIS